MPKPEGSVDFLSPWRISGWAWDAERPATPVEVAVVLDGTVLATVVANAFRGDLKEGERTGYNAFDITFDPVHPADLRSIRCVIRELNYDLPVGTVGQRSILKAIGASYRERDRTAATAVSPLFITGSPRSGTTILSRSLTAVGYSGYDEGHLVNLILPIREATNQHFLRHRAGEDGQLLSHVDKRSLYQGLLNVIAQFQNDLNPAALWMDKTPSGDMIEIIWDILDIWPNAGFIFAKRRAIENVYSRLRKFPGVSFEVHCDDWAKIMGAWRKVRDARPPAIEIDQHDVAHDALGVSEKLGAFLGLSKKNISKIAELMLNAHPEQTSTGSAHRILSLETTGWSDLQIECFKRICGVEMEKFGYTYDESYRVS